MKREHQLDLPQLPRYEPAVEYDFPLGDDQREVLTLLNAGDSWMRSMANADDTASRQELLRRRFLKDVPSKLWPLMSLLAGYEPASPVFYEGRTWIRCEATGRFGESRQFLISEPEDPQSSAPLFRDLEPQVRPLIAEFFARVKGLRERYPPTDGAFLDQTEWCITDELFFDEPHDWWGTLGFYSARNGDSLLLGQDGSVAWCRHDERTVRPIEDGFTGFLATYQHHLQYALSACHYDGPGTGYGDWPFDAYAPPCWGHPDGRVTENDAM